jgi:two-component system OmpR family response regulator
VDQAADGRQALACFADHPCDLILMDVYMPYMDGLETCRRLRRVSDVPILMLSATGEATIQEMAFGSGANAFLPKPLELEGLLTWVRTISSAQVPIDYN